MSHPNPLNPTGNSNENAPSVDALRAARETLSWLEPLVANPEFKRFMEDHFGPVMIEHGKKAMDVSKSKDERDIHAQRHHALAEVFYWPQQQITRAMAVLDAEKSSSSKPKPSGSAL